MDGEGEHPPPPLQIRSRFTLYLWGWGWGQGARYEVNSPFTGLGGGVPSHVQYIQLSAYRIQNTKYIL
jgi:hypothetical protein